METHGVLKGFLKATAIATLVAAVILLVAFFRVAGL